MQLSDTPKYLQLKEFIKGLIQHNQLKPGEKIYSENELAEKFSISRHTVRQAVGELVNEGWLYRSQGKGTFVARQPNIQKERSKIIGVVTTYLNDYIFPSIIKGIDVALSSKGYSIVLGHTNSEIEKERACLNNLLDKNIDGLIVEPTKSALPNPNLDIYRELSAKGIPIIFIHGYYSDLHYSYVIEDDILAGYLATKHLIDLGHDHVVGIFKVDDIQGHGRFKGFTKAYKEKGLPIQNHSVIWFSTEDKDTMFDSSRYDELLMNRLENCTALVCYNDQIAIKIIDMLRKRGIKVPQDISIVSFDDSDISTATEVKLTTVAHPKEKLGERAAELLVAMIEGKEIHVEEIMEPKLIVRESTRRWMK
ncbi:MAG: GntR family transcriptional regulator, arabinose operon transcriptional repressor [Petroclostridium sp.]|jgi:GntR family transcriptional regulator of arabinose operon|uniref:GntR family transcriptional regulator n=1 Tax=Petroclostridium xylanilyticum TaxID=1792311 RepID=UPI000B97E295|nr:GntR family transcriptional regulator [Petroclostridium xylanilyticum]MBZ4646841.1 araR2 [Clostridia bacterium]MDK2809355.1 GntR family transcriptional regulator, arabinose operon transcriptional repressor [Petroclostridium sp.]